jgi:translation initiation factor 2B subunit (eIF-2B alpha/beta/delta family)
MLIRGMHPQTGQEVDEWGCAVTWMPMLTIENSQQQRQTGAAVESFRNEVVKSAEKSQHLIAADIHQRIEESKKIYTLTHNDAPNNT